jgi:hypothetical protein
MTDTYKTVSITLSPVVSRASMKPSPLVSKHMAVATPPPVVSTGTG